MTPQTVSDHLPSPSPAPFPHLVRHPLDHLLHLIAGHRPGTSYAV
jgi:hypothetical protein